MKARKVSVVGAGNVGSTLAMNIAQGGLADVTLLDIYKNLAKAKALDIKDALAINCRDCNIIGTDDYADVKGSDVIVITAGITRKPGMHREDLIATNASIVKGVSENIKKFAPDAVIIVVTNPLDAMTYLAKGITGFDRKRVVGMAGVLDGGRLINQIATNLGCSMGSVEALVMGSHGNEMVPVYSHTKLNLEKISESLPKKAQEAQGILDNITQATKNRGAEIVKLLGSGSAYYAPSAAIFKMVNAVIKDTKELMAASIYLEGEYGLKDVCVGVPVIIGSSGVDSIVEIELSKQEKDALEKAAESIKKTTKML